jgi:IS4 transposase
MLFDELLDRFLERSPFTVMVRSVLENLLRPLALDDLFARVADRQYTRQILFSTLVDLMGLVVCRIRPSMHAAYNARPGRVGASLSALYDKLNHLEPPLAAALLHHVARDAAAVIDALSAPAPGWPAGLEVRILDGNHLAGTERRLRELRRTRQAALPGQALVVLDPARGLATQVVPCADAYARERALLDEVLPTIGAGELWIADRNFCTAKLAAAAVRRSAFFIVREHANAFPYRAPGARRPVGRCATGAVYEQAVEAEPDGRAVPLRRVTVELDQPTEDGDREIHLLTNPGGGQAGGCLVAELYRGRWTIEGVFQQLTEALRCEVDTPGYPRAALFGFCTALVAFNAVSVAKAALRSVHGAERVAEVSDQQLLADVAAVHEGLDIALPGAVWATIQALPAEPLGRLLQAMARHVPLERFRKHRRGPKKPRPRRTSGAGSPHVSTARLLATRNKHQKPP